MEIKEKKGEFRKTPYSRVPKRTRWRFSRFSRFSLWRFSLSPPLPLFFSLSPHFPIISSIHNSRSLPLTHTLTPASPFFFFVSPPPSSLPSGNFACGPLRLYHNLSLHHGRRQKACRLDHRWSRYVLNSSSPLPISATTSNPISTQYHVKS